MNRKVQDKQLTLKRNLLFIQEFAIQCYTNINRNDHPFIHNILDCKQKVEDNPMRSTEKS